MSRHDLKESLQIKFFLISFMVLYYVVKVFIVLPMDITYFLPNLNIHLIFITILLSPGIITPLMLFILGCVEDVIFGYNLGVNALKYLLVKLIVQKYRKPYIFANFVYTWIGFVFCLLLIDVYTLFMNSVLKHLEVKYQYLVIEFVVSAVAFPLMFYMLEILYTKPAKIKI